MDNYSGRRAGGAANVRVNVVNVTIYTASASLLQFFVFWFNLAVNYAMSGGAGGYVSEIFVRFRPQRTAGRANKNEKQQKFEIS